MVGWWGVRCLCLVVHSAMLLAPHATHDPQPKWLTPMLLLLLLLSCVCAAALPWLLHNPPLHTPFPPKNTWPW